MAEAAGARYVETLTGFKWIMRARRRGARPAGFVLGYEEALGYRSSDSCATRTASRPRS